MLLNCANIALCKIEIILIILLLLLLLNEYFHRDKF